MPNQATDTLTKNARRDQVQDRLFAVDHQCMAGIVATLKAHDSCCTIRQQVHNLSFAFVTPLGADDNYIFSHGIPACLKTLPGKSASDHEQGDQPDDHHDQTNRPDVIVAQLRDFRHQLPVLFRRDERQHTLNDENQCQRRKNLGSYRFPPD